MNSINTTLQIFLDAIENESLIPIDFNEKFKSNLKHYIRTKYNIDVNDLDFNEFTPKIHSSQGRLNYLYDEKYYMEIESSLISGIITSNDCKIFVLHNLNWDNKYNPDYYKFDVDGNLIEEVIYINFGDLKGGDVFNHYYLYDYKYSYPYYDPIQIIGKTKTDYIAKNISDDKEFFMFVNECDYVRLLNATELDKIQKIIDNGCVYCKDKVLKDSIYNRNVGKYIHRECLKIKDTKMFDDKWWE